VGKVYKFAKIKIFFGKNIFLVIIPRPRHNKIVNLLTSTLLASTLLTSALLPSLGGRHTARPALFVAFANLTFGVAIFGKISRARIHGTLIPLITSR
jgi:hypothetical protein